LKYILHKSPGKPVVLSEQLQKMIFLPLGVSVMPTRTSGEK
jgi:hypothetical protein